MKLNYVFVGGAPVTRAARLVILRPGRRQVTPVTFYTHLHEEGGDDQCHKCMTPEDVAWALDWRCIRSINICVRGE